MIERLKGKAPKPEKKISGVFSVSGEVLQAEVRGFKKLGLCRDKNTVEVDTEDLNRGGQVARHEPLPPFPWSNSQIVDAVEKVRGSNFLIKEKGKQIVFERPKVSGDKKIGKKVKKVGKEEDISVA